MKGVIIIVFLFFSLSAFAQVQADDKLYIGKSGSIYAVKSSVKKETCVDCYPKETYLKAWIFFDSPSDPGDHLKELYCIKCKEQTIWIKYSYTYGLGGKLIGDNPNLVGMFKEIIPGSSEEIIVKTLCKYAKEKGL